MTVAIRGASAAADTAVSPQDLDASGGTLPGTNPKGAIYLISGGTTLGTNASHARFGIGMTDGTTQRAIGGLFENGLATASADRGIRLDNATVIQFPLTPSEAIDGEASWSAWNTNGSELTWGNFLAAANRIGALYFFGDEVECSRQDIQTPASIGGTVAITGLSFRPNLFIVTNRATGADQTQASYNIGVGFACEQEDGTLLQGGSWVSGFDRHTVNTNCAQTLFTTGVFKRTAANSTGGADAGPRIVLDSVQNDGATFRTEDVAAVANLTVLCLRIPRSLWIGVPTLDNTSTGNKPITDPGFEPIATMWVATAMTAINTTVSTGVEPAHFSLGWATGDEELCAGIQSEDSATTSNDRSVMALDLVNIPGSGGATNWSASHVSFDSTGQTINIDDAASSAFLSVALYIGAERNAPAMSPATRRARQRRGSRQSFKAARLGRTPRRGSAAAPARTRKQRGATPRPQPMRARPGTRIHRAVQVARARLATRRLPGRPQTLRGASTGRRAVRQGLPLRLLRFWERQRRAMLDRLFRKKPKSKQPTEEGVPVEQQPKGTVATSGLRRGAVVSAEVVVTVTSPGLLRGRVGGPLD